MKTTLHPAVAPEPECQIHGWQGGVVECPGCTNRSPGERVRIIRKSAPRSPHLYVVPVYSSTDCSPIPEGFLVEELELAVAGFSTAAGEHHFRAWLPPGKQLRITLVDKDPLR